MMSFWQIYIIAIKMEWNGPVIGQILHFGPFSFKKQQKGCQKDKKSNFTKSTFQTPGWFGHNLLFWDEKRSWLGRGGLWCGYSVPRFELDFCPDHWGGPFGPKLHDMNHHLVVSFKHDLHQKSHISGHLLSWWPPLVNIMITVRGFERERKGKACMKKGKEYLKQKQGTTTILMF